MNQQSMNQIDKQKLLALRQQNIGRLFQRAARAYSELALEKLHTQGHEGLTLFHTALISNLDVEGTNIKVLAERAGVSKQAMGQLADELEKRGYIRAVKDTKDKRATLISFTEKGWQFLQDAYKVKQDIERDYSVVLGKRGLKQLSSLLETLLRDPKSL
jgi:DNA-binding MarR family transcriptional regulator